MIQPNAALGSPAASEADSVDSQSTSNGFVHLHLHSQYSLLDGGNRLDRLVKRVAELGMDAVAVTDHGNLFGAAEFYAKAKDAGIKPILGIEAYVAPGDRTDKTRSDGDVFDGGFHLVLLAENETGWKNLLKLSSDSFLEGFYHRPRMDKTTLAQWCDGLIAINGHLGSSIAHHLVKYHRTEDEKHYQAALEEARWHQETFGVNEQGESRFFLEVQAHDVADQRAINPHIVRMAQELDLPIVGDNDAHFLLAEDWDSHDTLCCISMKKVKSDPKRNRYPKELYVKSPQQMQKALEGFPGAYENTRRIAERCDVDLDFSANHAPVVKIVCDGGAVDPETLPTDSEGAVRMLHEFQCEHPMGTSEWFKAFCGRFELQPYDSEKDTESEEQLKKQCDGALRLLTEAGGIWRYGPEGVVGDVRARMERELKILADKLISAYFMIVWDFVNEARRKGIPVNARGSGVGTMVGYCLGLSNACPVQYGLLFERFTDPDRSEYPDIDIDMCQDNRQGLIEYVRNKYGYVAQIITFNVLKAKAAVRDVGRVQEVPLDEVDKLCKLIGDGLKTTIASALEDTPELRQTYENNPTHRNLLDTAQKLEGMARHAGVHAAGVIIATQPLQNIVPLYRPPGTDQTVTQWDGPTCEQVGLLKMDFLGLRTLSILERARKLIRTTLDEQTIRRTVNAPETDPETGLPTDPLDLERLRFDDQRVLDLFRRGETAGVFQFESGGMRNLLMSMKPDRLEDLIAANALYRPGPMDLIPTYVGRKHGREEVPKVHPIVDKFTAGTYGIMVYQEQVMQIVNELGGIPLRQAYSLIKAISKKKQKTIDAMRPAFVEGAEQRGLTKQGAEELFELILKFAGYGFNKSHSSGYAIVAYQTAYLKTYFPVHYMAAVLTYESVDLEKAVEYIDECKRVKRPGGGKGVAIGPPDINRSYTDFTVVYEPGEPHDSEHGSIRFGLKGVAGVGEKAISAVIEARDEGGPFTSLYDFCERVPLQAVNKATIEALIKCGAFDEIHGRDQRAAMLEALEGAMQAGQRAAKDRDTGQLSFFEAFETAPASASSSAATAEKAAPTLPKVEPWSNAEMLQQEKSVLKFYISRHPMDDHRQALEAFTDVSVRDIQGLRAEVPVILGGMLTRVKTTLTKKNKEKMAMISLEDKTGSIEGVIFPKMYALYGEALQPDAIVVLKGKVDRRREEPAITIDEAIPIQQAAQRFTRKVRIRLMGPGGETANPGLINSDGAPVSLSPVSPSALKHLLKLLHNPQNRRSHQTAEVEFEVFEAGKRVLMQAPGLRVRVSSDLPQQVGTLLEQDPAACCALIGPEKLAPKLLSSKDLTHDGAPAASAAFNSSHEDVCDSVDRY